MDDPADPNFPHEETDESPSDKSTDRLDGHVTSSAQGETESDVSNAGPSSTSDTVIRARTCSVCGDKAISYNFGAVTCESCKAFFRRKSTTEEELPCAYEGNCIINVQTRKYCQSCRLRKCFEVGMMAQNAKKRKRLQLQRPRLRLEANMRRRKEEGEEAASTYAHTTVKSDSGDIVSDTAIRPHSPFQGVDETRNTQLPPLCSLGEFLTRTGNKTDITFNEDSLFVTIRVPKSHVRDILLVNCDASTSRSTTIPSSSTCEVGVEEPVPSCVYTHHTSESTAHVQDPYNRYSARVCESAATSAGGQGRGEGNLVRVSCHTGASDPRLATQTRYGHVIRVDGSIGGGRVSPLTSPINRQLEINYIKLEELHIADKEWTRDNGSISPRRVCGAADFSIGNYNNLLYHLFSCVIRQHTRLSAFKKLPKGDQLALVKGTPNQLLFIRALAKFDERTGLLNTQNPRQPLIHCSITDRIRDPVGDKSKDAVAFFDPSQPHLVHKVAVEAERQVYLRLLMDVLGSKPVRLPPCTIDANQNTCWMLAEDAGRPKLLMHILSYLTYAYGEEHARRGYQHLVNCVDELSLWTRANCRGVIFDVNPRSYELLMIEFFNFG